jgi:hypothetical protein
MGENRPPVNPRFTEEELARIARARQQSNAVVTTRPQALGYFSIAVLPTRKPLRPPSRLGRQQDSCELAGASHHNPLASSVALVCEQITSILAARRPCK